MKRRQLKRRLDLSMGICPMTVLAGCCGASKTSLARRFAGRYFDLRNVEQRARLIGQWKGIVHGEGRIVLDGIASMPELFPLVLGDLNRFRQWPPGPTLLLLSSVHPTRLADSRSVVLLTPLLLGELGVRADLEQMNS